MKTKGFILTILSLAFGVASAMAGQPHCIQTFENGTINWSTGKVVVTGKAAPETDTEGKAIAVPGSARADAIRNTISILKQISISPGLTVGDYASKHDIILAGIEKTAQDAVITRQLYTSALDVEVFMEAPIFGGFLQLVLPDHIRQIPKISQLKTDGETKTKQPAQVPVNHIPYTGLIVDARELALDPILYPTIVSEQGKEIYSSLFVSREFAVQYGVCTYLCDMTTALSIRRTGSNPLVFKALRKAGDKTGAIVVSMADAKTLEKATERHKFLKECRVIIVIDRFAGENPKPSQ